MRIHLPLVAAAVLAASSALAQPAPHLGRWVTESGNLEVEIAPCGEALCGTVVKVLANRSMSAAVEEMKPADTRPALGMVILSGLKPAGDGELRGEIYNRENAKTYSASVSFAQPDQLLVRGYVGLPVFGKTQVWRRPAAAGAAR
jgi:uncharacterized protein (DUF2147 family)